MKLVAVSLLAVLTIVCAGAGAAYARPAAPAPLGQADLAKGIRKLARNHYTVTRDLYDRLCTDTGFVARSFRVGRAASGQPAGFTLLGIRKGALPTRLGLQNGDLVVEFNDRPLTNVAEALAAYPTLFGARHLALKFYRRGAPERLQIEIE